MRKAMHVLSNIPMRMQFWMLLFRRFRFGQRGSVPGCKHSCVPGFVEFPTEGRTFEGFAWF